MSDTFIIIIRSLGTLALSGFATIASFEVLLNYWNMDELDFLNESKIFFKPWLNLTEFVISVAISICYSTNFLNPKINKFSKNDLSLHFVKYTINYVNVYIQKVFHFVFKKIFKFSVFKFLLIN